MLLVRHGARGDVRVPQPRHAREEPARVEVEVLLGVAREAARRREQERHVRQERRARSTSYAGGRYRRRGYLGSLQPSCEAGSYLEWFAAQPADDSERRRGAATGGTCTWIPRSDAGSPAAGTFRPVGDTRASTGLDARRCVLGLAGDRGGGRCRTTSCSRRTRGTGTSRSTSGRPRRCATASSPRPPAASRRSSTRGWPACGTTRSSRSTPSAGRWSCSAADVVVGTPAGALALGACPHRGRDLPPRPRARRRPAGPAARGARDARLADRGDPERHVPRVPLHARARPAVRDRGVLGGPHRAGAAGSWSPGCSSAGSS